MNVASPNFDYLDVQEYLIGLKKRGVRLGLGRMERFMAALGHPEKTVPCVHVAGTNGKGSVAAMARGDFPGGWLAHGTLYLASPGQTR